MPSFVLTDARIEINAVNMSPFCTSATLKLEVDDQEDTAFGDTYRSRVPGLKDWSCDFDFNSDFAASAVDQTLWPLFGTSVSIKIRPTSGSISATNPEYSGQVLVTEYTPIDGGVGDLATTKVSWPGNGTLSRATT